MSIDEIFEAIGYERRKLIKELFGDNRSFLPRSKVIKYHKVLEGIETDKLIDFSIYMDTFREEFVSVDVAMQRAVNAYKKALILSEIKKGKKALKSIKEVERFCKLAFRGEDLFSGCKGSPYIEGVVICIDDEGNLRNKFIVNKNGVFQRLDSFDTKRVWEYLFKHQERIGVIEYKEVKVSQIEKKDEKLKVLDTNTKAYKMVENVVKRIGND
ncbi:hypothetical protein [Campylobacter corcagiensis]|uniref:Uncharacterized protein n=1 Tax=Campylobacter corcagiensis TaxID=1448857 RepID=A0A7M1LG19_9BACT|nr:hypothetical protein [Campylobacter corcagiensis]QKF64576.1 hypothetical protein CCORG_0715 [Campylobacter corcagiensis]QOQ87251.1 hypothetical protein IMC76_08595 [Campylobacter corcagiensis]